MKKTISLLVMLCMAVMLVSCGEEAAEQQESVVRKTAEQFEDYNIEQTELKSAGNYEENGVHVSVTGLSYEDVATTINMHVKNDTDQPLRVVRRKISLTEEGETLSKQVVDELAQKIANSMVK